MTTTDLYFDDVLPNYEAQCAALAVVLIATSIFWIVIFPFAIGKLFFDESSEQSKQKAQEEDSKAAATQNDNNSNGKTSAKQQRRGKTKKGGAAAEKKKKPTTVALPKNDDDQPPPPAIPLVVLAIAALGCMVSLFYEVMTLSPYNTFVARGVFQVPMLTAAECEHLVDISMRVAHKNQQSAFQVKEMSSISGEPMNRTMEGLLWEPVGWQKLRHQNYPTTDLNIITDPFTKDDLNWLQEKLDARLAPTLSKIHGIPESAIRANDMFVVRYDSDYRARLSNHTDDADISINVLLTEDFEGGGTQFWNRQLSQPFAHVQPTKVGQMLAHSALINHEGMPTTNGTRIILVGFLSVDRLFPFTGEHTGLSTFASWLSLPWLSTKFKEAYVSAHLRIGVTKQQKWSNNKYIIALFLDLANVMQIVGDYFAKHHVHNLVSEANTEAYLQALDDAYQTKLQQRQSQQQPIADTEKASWFAGQQIDLDIDGTITQEWSTRQNSRNRFMEL